MVRLDRCDVDEESKVAAASLGGTNGKHLRDCRLSRTMIGASSSLFERLVIDTLCRMLKRIGARLSREKIVSNLILFLSYCILDIYYRLIRTRMINYNFFFVKMIKNNITLLNKRLINKNSSFFKRTIGFKHNILYNFDAIEVIVFITLYDLREMANSKS